MSGAPPPGDLTLTPSQAAKLLDAAARHILTFHDALARGDHPASYVADSADAGAYTKGRLISAELREDDVPAAPTEVEPLLEELFGRAMANGTVHPHPGFMAHVPSGGLLQGAVGQFIAKAVNRFGGVWLAAPGLQRIEANVIRWFCTMLGYGEGSFGYLTTGGSLANLMGMACAVHHAEGPAGAHTVYVSDQGHFSIAKAAGLAGIPADRIRVVGTDAGYAMNLDELAERITADRAAGLVPACVVATAGTTNTGAIDDLPRISALCQAQGVWLHADACLGGFFRITRRGREALTGIEQADSVSVDAHKSLFLPHGSSALLVKDKSRLRAAFEIPGADYLPGFSTDPELVDFCNYGPDLSREIRGLDAWLPLKMHGVSAFERCLDEKLDLANYLADQLPFVEGLEVVRRHPVHLPVVTFRMMADVRAVADRLTARLCELVCASGRVYLTTTRLPDHGLVVRACILHHRTDRAVVDQLLDDVRRSVAHLRLAEAA